MISLSFRLPRLGLPHSSDPESVYQTRLLVALPQGLACYLVEQFGEDAARARGVIVGYDARHNSLRYSILHIIFY